ncbi:MAG: PAS domain S-box protein [Kiritimatiellae bacterium]|jgi:PAS domain S-box-containing protein|nr:PAS domain S-box protein [Kiritimatiellia bacterium]
MTKPKTHESKAEETARSRLAAIVESSDDAIIGKDLNGIITSWNMGAEKIFGYTAEEMVGTSILQLFPPERQEEEDFILGKIGRDEMVDHFETVRQTKDGRLIDVSVSISPIKDAAGNIVGASKIARDITDRKTHEQEILRLSRLYAALSQINQAIVWTRDRDELFEKICRLLVEEGKFSMAWIGQTDEDTRRVNPVAQWGDDSDYLSQVKIYTDERPEGQGPVGRAIREGTFYICNDFTRDPTTVPWHELAEQAGFRAMAAFPIHQNEEVCGAIIVYSHEIEYFRDKESALLKEAANDVSFALDFLSQDEKRRQAEETLRECEERYKALFDRSLNCVFINDFDGKFLDANQASLDLLGYPREEFTTLTFASLLSEDQLPLAFHVLEEIKATGHHKHPTEYRLRGKDGRLVFVETQSSLIYRKGKPFAIQGIARDLTERKQATAALVESEKRFRELVQNMPIALVEHGPDTTVSYANPMACRLLGLTLEQMLGKTAIDPAWHFLGDEGSKLPLDDYPVNMALQAVDGTISDLVLGIRRLDREDTTWVQCNGHTVRNMVGDIQQVVITFSDLTELRRAEEAQRDAQARYQILFDQSPDGVVIIDPETARLLEFNETAHRQLGYSREEFAQLSIFDLDVAETPEETRARIRNVSRDGRNDFETLHRTRQGEIRNIQVTAQYTEELGSPVCHCVWRDITAQKQAAESQARLATAVEQAAEAIIITDTSGTILFVNPSFEAISGYTRAEVLGRNPSILKGGKHDAAFYRSMWDTLGAGEAWQSHFINSKKDGALYEVEATVSPVRDAAGAVVNYVAVQRDVTHEVQLEAQFRQSQKMESVGRLAGGVAHDFNNMLQIILAYAEMSILDMEPGQSLYPKLQEIKQATLRSASLTRQLLAFARIQPTNPKILHLNETVSDMFKMLQRLISEDIKLVWRPGENLNPIRIDPTQIDQILVNLCVNAQDAISGNGEIIIETGNVTLDHSYCAIHAELIPGDYVFLTVSDTGCGMDAETLEKIFEPFFTTKEVGKGTGLGLATVYGIVKQNQGFIYPYSEPGQGTTFKVYLPQIKNPSPESDGGDAAPRLPDARGETVLLVEDEPALRDVYTLFLDELGYTVLSAETPEEALRVSAQHADVIQLLLTDVVMPGMNGKELSEAVRAINPSIKVLFMSGYSTDVIAHHGVLDQDADFIAKPFSYSDLARKVHDVLKSRTPPKRT